MLFLNFSNVEELIFFDWSVQRKLPTHMFSIFEQWRLGQMVPYLRETGKMAVLDFLNGLSDRDVEVLEEHFGEKIIVEKLNYSIAFNIKVPLGESKICEELCKIEGFNRLTMWRDDEYLYLCVWR